MKIWLFKKKITCMKIKLYTENAVKMTFTKLSPCC